MLNLATPTDPGWFDRVSDRLDVVLVDHCHLEKRAASSALNMIFRYTGREGLPRLLSTVVKEEMEHFEQVLDLLDAREIEFVRLTPSPYASTLLEGARRQEPDAFLDRLLVAALIEARSCERFQILGRRLDDEELAEFYRELAISEARHHTLYTGLARKFFAADEVKSRLTELAELESSAVEASRDEPRLHSW